MEVEPKPDLWIQVPLTPPSPQAEVPLPSMSPQQPQLSCDPVEYERIRELPTPVVNNGSFAFTGELVFNKPRANPLGSLPPRVILDYRPALLLDRLNLVGSKRVTSQPPVAGLARALSMKLPLPPIKAQAPETHPSPNYLGRVFVAPKTGTEYNVTHQIGRGNFSTVVSAVLGLGRMVAVKIIRIPPIRDKITNFKSFLVRELNVLSHLNHPCIVQLVDFSTSLSIDPQDLVDTTIFKADLQVDLTTTNQQMNQADFDAIDKCRDQLIFLNYCQGGNLYQFIIAHSPPSALPDADVYWRILQRIAHELMAAVSYMHSQNIVHRDIKLENVLLNYEIGDMIHLATSSHGFGTTALINLTDFGLSKRLGSSNELLLTRCGLTDYVPPEVLMGLRYDGRLTDLWSVGVVLYSLLERRLPFDAPPTEALAKAGVSPSVIRRRQAKNNPSHRIAMIDWHWNHVTDMVEDEQLSTEVRRIIVSLQKAVNVLLVRKEKRGHVSQLVDFSVIPRGFMN